MRTTALMALGVFSLGISLPAQEATERAPNALGKQDQQRQAAIEQHLQQLGSDRYRERSQAERKLRSLGEAALPRLREVAEQDGDPEAQWRARRLIRQIESGEESGLEQRYVAPDHRGGTGHLQLDRQPLDHLPEELRAQVEELLGRIDLDVSSGPFGGGLDFGADIEDRLRAMQDRAWPGIGKGLAPMMGRGMSMKMDESGVRVEVTEKDKDGKDQQKVYEAPDLETFREKYPGVLGEDGSAGLDGLGIGEAMPDLESLFQGLSGRDGAADPKKLRSRRNVGRDWPVGDPQKAVAPPAGERLGVLVQPEIPAAVLDYLGIDHGLMVQEVQADSLAAALGLAAKDIVVEIAGRKIASTADVREALGAIEAGNEVAVTVLRRGKELVLRAAKPAVATESKKAGALQPRKK